jgi:cullin-associated NEDD8-dissociated protein 1
MESKSTQTRQIGFHLLRELVNVLNGGLAEQIELFIPIIESSLSSSDTDHQVASSSNLKIEILTFLRLFFRRHTPESIHPYLSKLPPAIIKAISDKFYRITAESFLVCMELIKVIRPIQFDASTGKYQISTIAEQDKPFVFEIYNATLKILNTNDADQEVKEKSIACLGTLLTQAGDILQAQQKEAWDVLLDRIGNEVTRLISVKTLNKVSKSPVSNNQELTKSVLAAVDDISLLLRKSNRPLRIASLECLTTLVQRFGESISKQSYVSLLNELNPLISDSDLHLLPLSLKATESILTKSPECVDYVKETTLRPLFNLIQSPLLQGTALDSLLKLFSALAKASPGDYQSLVKSLVDPLLHVQTSGVSAGGVAAVANKQAASTAAQCVAVLAVTTDVASRDSTVKNFQSYILDPATNDSVKYLSLLTIGEIGRRT